MWYLAGPKCGRAGRKQLARFWNNFHDLGLIPIPLLPDCAHHRPATGGPHTAMGPEGLSAPTALIGLFAYMGTGVYLL
jgi:hypothetical protein